MWIMTKDGWKQFKPEAIPAGSNQGMYPHDPSTDARTDAYLRQMREAHDQWQRMYREITTRRG